MVFQPRDEDASVFANRGGIFGALRRSGIAEAIASEAMRQAEVSRQQKNIEADRDLRRQELGLRQRELEAGLVNVGGKEVSADVAASLTGWDPEVQKSFSINTGLPWIPRSLTRGEEASLEATKVGTEAARASIGIQKAQLQLHGTQLATDIASKFNDAEGNPLTPASLTVIDKDGLFSINLPADAVPKEEFAEQLENLSLIFGGEDKALQYLLETNSLGIDATKSEILKNKAQALALIREAQAALAALGGGGKAQDVVNSIVKTYLFNREADTAGANWTGKLKVSPRRSVEDFSPIVRDLGNMIADPNARPEVAAVRDTLTAGGTTGEKAMRELLTNYFLDQDLESEPGTATKMQTIRAAEAVLADPDITPAQATETRGKITNLRRDLDNVRVLRRNAIQKAIDATKVTSKTETVLADGTNKIETKELSLVNMLSHELRKARDARLSATSLLSNTATRNPGAFMAFATGQITMPSLQAPPDSIGAAATETEADTGSPFDFLDDIDTMLQDAGVEPE